MSTAFALDHARLAADPRFAEIARELGTLGPISSSASFNRYCRGACRLWSEAHRDRADSVAGRFTEFLQLLDRGGKSTIRTSWGGVVIERHEHPAVEKYLVIRKGGYLALETHTEKDERLEVREGAGLILSRRAKHQPLIVEALRPGRRFHFEPGMEHCIVGTENLLVFERSTDPRGMDQDLVFIYEPKGIPAH